MSTSAPTAWPSNHITQSFTPLARTVRDSGMLQRHYGFYATYVSALFIALGAVIAGIVLLGDSWLQLLMAGALGIVFTQFAFFGHEASHRTVFVSGIANDTVGKVTSTLMVGISYQWWMNKHSRHHANPNTRGKDPDIEIDTISFLPEDAAKARGLQAWITRRQGWLFFPLLTLEGLNLHRLSYASLLRFGSRRDKVIELSLISTHFVLYLVPLFMFLPLGMAFAFLGVQLAVFGVYMGASFAPNHKGMAIIPADVKVDFLSKQVLTARNVTGGWPVNILMGGLNYQIEHHLFPNMARPYLPRAQEVVKEYCASIGLPYTEATLIDSYRQITAYLNEVGLSARDPFECHLKNSLRS